MTRQEPLPTRDDRATFFYGALCLTLWTAWLRFWQIGRLNLWFDEGYTAWVVAQPMRSIVRVIRADTAPPLYYLLLHVWTLFTEHGEAGLRSLSAIAAAISVWLCALIGRRLLGVTCGLAAAALLSLSFMQQWYGQEARAYELMVLEVLVMAYAAVARSTSQHTLKAPAAGSLGVGASVCRQSLNRLDALFILGALAGLYTHNIMPLYMMASAIAALVLARRGEKRRWLVVFAIIALLYLPWLFFLRSQVRRIDQGFWIDRPTINAVCLVIGELAGVRHLSTWDHLLARWMTNRVDGVPRLATALCAMFIAALLMRKKTRRSTVALSVLLLLPALVAAVVSLWRTPIFTDKLFVPSTPFMALLVASAPAYAVSRWGKRLGWFSVLFVGCTWAVNLGSFIHEETKEPWRNVAMYVQRLPAQRRLIVFVAPEAQLPFDYYYRLKPGETQTGAPSGFFDVDPPIALRRVMDDGDLDGLKKVVASARWEEIVLIDSHAGWIDADGKPHPGFADPLARTARYIASLGRIAEAADFPDSQPWHPITVWRCVPGSAPQAAPYEYAAR